MRRAHFITMLLAVTTATAAPAPKLVALLPLDTANASLDASARSVLDETIRTVSGARLATAGFTLLTGDTTLRILADNGIDASKACEASCALDAARELQAALFLSGSVSKADDRLFAFVRLYESAEGRQLAMLRLEGDTVSALVHAFEARAPELFSAIGQPVTAVVEPPAPVQEDPDNWQEPPKPAPAPVVPPPPTLFMTTPNRMQVQLGFGRGVLSNTTVEAAVIWNAVDGPLNCVGGVGAALGYFDVVPAPNDIASSFAVGIPFVASCGTKFVFQASVEPRLLTTPISWGETRFALLASAGVGYGFHVGARSISFVFKGTLGLGIQPHTIGLDAVYAF